MDKSIAPEAKESSVKGEAKTKDNAPPTNEQNAASANNVGATGGKNWNDLSIEDDSEVEVIPITSSEESSSLSLDNGSKKATVGEKCTLLPTEIADMRKRERSKCSSSKIGNFFTLCTGAQMLLPNTPVIRSNPNEIAREVAEARAADKPGESSKSGDQAKKPKKASEPPTFFCELCDITSTSEQTHITHLQGKKHRKKLAAASGMTASASNYVDEYEASEMQRFKIEDAIPPYRVTKHGCLPKIQTKLDSTDSPCVGLNYVTEILQLDPTIDPLYVCRLCTSICQPTTLLSHVTGYKHRLNYLKVESPSTYAEIKVLTVKKSELTKILEDQALLLEERNGRGQMVVEQEVSRPPRDSYEMERPTIRSPRPSIQPPHPPKPQFSPSPFQIEEVRFMPHDVRMEMLEELSHMNSQELITDADASRLEFAISNFRQALTRYRGLVGMTVNQPNEYSMNPVNRSRPMPPSPTPHDARPMPPSPISYDARPMPQSSVPYDARPMPQSSMQYDDARPSQGENGRGSWRLMANREVRYPAFYDYPRSKYY